MRTMQEKILGALEYAAKANLMEVTNQPAFSNTGHLYVTRIGMFAVHVEASYVFNNTYCVLTFSGPGIEALHLSDSPPAYRIEDGDLAFHHLDYSDEARIREMISLFSSATKSSRNKA